MSQQEIIPADTASAPRNNFAVESKMPSLRGLTAQPAVRRALPALAGVLALSLAGAAWWGLQASPQRPLFTELGDGDKSAVADALQSGGIPYKINSDTGSITVGEDDVHRARILLAGQGLPKAAPSGSTMMAALPMGSSRAVEGEALRGARESDLARTIEAVDAVKTARVHLATPEPSVFVREAVLPAASVMLTLQAGRTLSDAQVRAIKHLVAASVPSMAPDQVTVIDQAGTLLSQPGANGENDAFQLQMQMEERYRQSVIALLTPVAGVGNFSTEVHVDVDQSESQSTRESYPKDDRALISEQGTRSSGGSAAASPPAIGIPGALSNQPPPASQLATQPSPAATSVPPAAGGGRTSEENFSRRFDVGREISVTHQPVGKVRRLSVAVAVRDAKGGKPRSQKELAALETLVKGAVGFDAARGDVVAITSRPFAETEAEEPSFWQASWFMPAMRQIGALIAALLVFLFIGRPLVKAIKTRIETMPPPQANPPAGGGRQAIQSGEITIDMIESAPSYAARAELVRDFVRQDPKRASLVVRNLVQEGANG